MIKTATDTTEEPQKRLSWTKEEKVITETAKNLFDSLGLELSSDLVITKTEEGCDLIMETEDNGIVIGYHGEVLEGLQLVLSLSCSKKLGYFIRVAIEVGEYKKNRSSWLENLALSAKEKALLEQKEVALPNLKSWERRVVHVFFESDPDIITESLGDGRERTLVVKPKNAA